MSLLLLLLLPVAGLVLVLWLYQYGQEQRKQERGGDKGTLRVRQSVTSELTIPGDVVGRVIGRHGLRVRQLEEESGARIKFKDQQHSQDKVRGYLSEHLVSMVMCGGQETLCVTDCFLSGPTYQRVAIHDVHITHVAMPTEQYRPPHAEHLTSTMTSTMETRGSESRLCIVHTEYSYSAGGCDHWSCRVRACCRAGCEEDRGGRGEERRGGEHDCCGTSLCSR